MAVASSSRRVGLPKSKWHSWSDRAFSYLARLMQHRSPANHESADVWRNPWVSRDRAAAQAAEQALHTERSLNSAILNATADLIVVLGLDGVIQFLSPGGIAAMEISNANALLGRHALIALKGSELQMAQEAFDEARAGRVGRFQVFRHTRRGTPKWWDCVVSPLFDATGRPERLVAVARDISILKQFQQRLANSEERLNLALSASGLLGLWEWDLVTNAVYADAKQARTYGIDPERAAKGLHLSEFIARNHPDDNVDADVLQSEMLNGKPAHTREIRMIRPDGAIRWLWSRGRVLPDEAGRPSRVLGVTMDITERKEAEFALQEANERLEERVASALAERATIEEALRQAQKMEAVGQLTGGIAHDFNNMLASIGGALEIMRNRIAQGRVSNLARYIDAAEGATRRASALTHRLLAFSRRQTLDPRPTEINQLIAGMQELISRAVGPGIDLDVMAAENLWDTLIDPHQLENALLNLCINARDAMPNGGRLTITTANDWLDESAARLGDLPVGHYALITVSDSGTGMTPEIITRAFDPFFTTKPTGKGTGLGLSMVYGFVRQSGGMVTITSEPGRGSSVSLHLPRYCCAPGATLRPISDGAGRAHCDAAILVVDDEASLRGLVTEVLQEHGYKTLEAFDGPSGLEILRSTEPVDLLITDVGMPGGMNGRQLADAARSLRPDLKVLFITGYANTAAIGTGDLEPGMQVLTKPFSMGTLQDRVDAIIS